MPTKTWFKICLIMFWHYEIKARLGKALDRFFKVYPGFRVM